MIPFKINSIIILLAGITIGIALSVLFQGCGDDRSEFDQPIPDKPAAIQKQAAEVETKYQQKIDSLKTGTQQLEKQLSSTRVQLTNAKRKNTALQKQVYDLIDRQGEIIDTAERLTNCDSLEEKVIDLIAVTNERDSLQQAEAQTLEEEIRMKDCTIATQQDAYQALQCFLDQSLKDQQVLSDQNEQYKKREKRRKVRSRLACIGLIIVSAITTNYLINH